MDNQLFEYISRYITASEEEKKAILGLNLFRMYPAVAEPYA